MRYHRGRIKLAAMMWLTFGAALYASADAPSVLDIVQGISQTSYTNYLQNDLYTRTGDNRGFGAEHDLARTSIYNSFASFGLQTTLHAFTYSSSTYYNVIGVLPGTTKPNEYLVLGAHYDSVNNPGADDNGSGTAGVLEAARALSGYTFEKTIIFAAFDREEQGLKGSTAWANEHAGWDIRGMVSIDMIAYNPSGASYDTALIYGRATSDPLKNALSSAVSTYGGINCSLLGQLDASDHAPFEWNGFQAALLIEGAVWTNPYYHQANDSVDTLNYIDYDYATRMTKGSAGWLASSAGPVGRRGPDPVPEFGTIFGLFGGSGSLLIMVIRRIRSDKLS